MISSKIYSKFDGEIEGVRFSEQAIFDSVYGFTQDILEYIFDTQNEFILNNKYKSNIISVIKDFIVQGVDNGISIDSSMDRLYEVFEYNSDDEYLDLVKDLLKYKDDYNGLLNYIEKIE